MLDPTYGFRLAMPEGSKWRLMNHKHTTDLGDITVLNHRRPGIEMHSTDADSVFTMPYPAPAGWLIERGHIRIAGPDGKVALTFAPA